MQRSCSNDWRCYRRFGGTGCSWALFICFKYDGCAFVLYLELADIAVAAACFLELDTSQAWTSQRTLLLGFAAILTTR